MKLEKIILSEKLYPLWRIGWLERAFFLACRRFGRQTAQKLFTDVWKGHDISWYQGAVNFQVMRDSGAKFVILRCGYKNLEDTMFDRYMLDVQGVLPFAVYHFFDPQISPVTQAQSIIESLAWYDYTGRIWLDFEFDWAGTYSASTYWKIYRDTLNAAGYKTGIYTRATWWDSRVGTLAAEFGRDPFWVAQYSSALTLIPKGAKDVLIWQSGSPTYYAGQTSPRIDYDLWNTDYNFDAEWNAITQPPPQNGETMEQWKSLVEGLAVRSGANPANPPAYTKVQDLKKNDIVDGVLDVAKNWIRIYKITRALTGTVLTPATGEWWCSGLPAYVEKVIVTPPPPVVITKPVSVTVSLEGYKPLTLSGEMEPM